MYRVAGPSEYLAITGHGIKDVKLAKKAMIWPTLQKYSRINVSPVNYTFSIMSMSKEKLLFTLPAVFTIGPRIDDHCSLLLYAKLVSSGSRNSRHAEEIVQGIIEGETRVLAASLPMEDIFKGAKEFKQQIFDKVQLELNQFGLHIYNANIKSLADVEGHEYFSYLGMKIQKEAANQAKIDVAEAKKMGDIGQKLREAETMQNASQIDTETLIIATQRKGQGKKEEIRVETELKLFGNTKEGDVLESNTALATKKAECDKKAQLAKVEALNAIDIRNAELKTILEKKNAETQTEKLKAELLSKACVDYEIKVQEANWEFYKKQREADAELYKKRQDAEACKASAESSNFVRQQDADSELYAKRREAEGVMALAEAESFYLSKLLEKLGGNYMAVRDYLMIKDKTYKKIAKINAQAVNGLQPKISLWSQGNANGGASGGALKDLAELYRMLPPLMNTVNEQTGMVPPAWLGSLSS